jgi:hypothetical protein
MLESIGLASIIPAQRLLKMRGNGAAIQKRTILERFMYADRNDNFMPDGFAMENLVSIDSTPGRDITQYTWVSTGNLEGVPGIKVLDPVLGFDDGHGAEQAPGVQCALRHARTR